MMFIEVTDITGIFYIINVTQIAYVERFSTESGAVHFALHISGRVPNSSIEIEEKEYESIRRKLSFQTIK